MLKKIKQFFQKKSLERFQDALTLINGGEEGLKVLDNAELFTKSNELREKAKGGAPLEELLPDAFALVREAARRTLNQRPFDTQILGGMVLASGAVAEMVTGEGKTLSAVAPAYLNALSGEGVHVVTVNDYLARRDAVWMGQIYRALGFSVSCIVPNAAYLYDPTYTQVNADSGTRINTDSIREDQRSNPHISANAEGSALLDKERDTTGSFLVQHEFLRPITRREAYLADITYGTNHEFGFDYLRDNLAYARTDQVQREPHYAIIDEIDSILIDEARTPLIISAPDAQSSDFYKTFARVVTNLQQEEDYTVDEKFRSVSITDSGVEKVEKMIGVQNIYAPEHLRLVHFLEESLKAKALYHRDKDYIVKNGEVIIVDEFTGRLLMGRRYNSGLHQAIEAKEGVVVKEESRTYAKISIQNYFRMYKKIAGMTGTAQTSAEEFHKVYKLEVISIPTNRPLVRRDSPDMIYKNAKAKWTAVVEEIKRRYEKGQPVLVGTTSIAKNELVSVLLSQAAIPHKMLNAKNNEGEGAIIAQAGRLKTVTVATNMAGRGVDVILGGNPPDAQEAAKIKELGGLYVLGTERHEARRIDNQLRGRSGRQGDPGESQFFLALDDDLLRIFGGEKIQKMMDRFNIPDDQPIEIGFVSKAIAEAQAKVEGANFDMRKHLLEYDDVLNKQRKAVYTRRQEILESVFVGNLSNLIFESAKAHYEKLDASFATMAQSYDMPEENAPMPDIKKIFMEAGIVTKESPWPARHEREGDSGRQFDATQGKPEEASQEKIESLLTKRSLEISLHPMAFRQLLSILDLLWMDHLEGLDALTESVGLRAYGQHDPLVEYRQEAHRLFKDFWINFNAWIFMNLFKLADSQGSAEKAQKDFASAPKIAIAKTLSQGGKVGRNDPCPCGSGKKYKKCHGK